MSLTWYFIHPGLVLLLSGFDYVTHMPLGFWCACISTVLGTGSRDSRCFTPFTGDPAVFFETATTRGWSCVQWWWYCVGVPAGRHIHTWARARKRTSARLELLYCLSGPGRRGKARAIQQWEGGRSTHTHKSSSRKTSTKFRRAVYYFFRETTQNFKILLINQNI